MALGLGVVAVRGGSSNPPQHDHERIIGVAVAGGHFVHGSSSGGEATTWTKGPVWSRPIRFLSVRHVLLARPGPPAPVPSSVMPPPDHRLPTLLGLTTLGRDEPVAEPRLGEEGLGEIAQDALRTS